MGAFCRLYRHCEEKIVHSRKDLAGLFDVLIDILEAIGSGGAGTQHPSPFSLICFGIAPTFVLMIVWRKAVL